MHKDEASQLFSVLGDPSRVKIVKMLYHNEGFTLEELENRMNLTLFELKTHLQILNENNLVLIQDNLYKCNREYVDTLMSFISTRCGCC